MAEQLGFDLPVKPALGRADFMVAPSNAIAVRMIDGWRDWPRAKLVLSGPPASGKTHLTHVWAELCGAKILAAADLETQALPDLAERPIAVEDVPAIREDAPAQEALFHLHNMLQAAGQPLLMTGDAPPSLWRMGLPDLQSRIDAAGHAALEPPDDTLLAAVLGKLFADRQLIPRPDVIPYLLLRMERSFAAAIDVVQKLDQRSLSTKRAISRDLARQILDSSP